jgi:hypothetical protein
MASPPRAEEGQVAITTPYPSHRRNLLCGYGPAPPSSQAAAATWSLALRPQPPLLPPPSPHPLLVDVPADLPRILASARTARGGKWCWRVWGTHRVPVTHCNTLKFLDFTMLIGRTIKTMISHNFKILPTFIFFTGNLV